MRANRSLAAWRKGAGTIDQASYDSEAWIFPYVTTPIDLAYSDQ